MAMKRLMLLLLLLPCAVQAQIFRCEAKGDTYYSQIPCADSSEAVVIDDRRMFSEDAGVTAKPPEQPAAAPEPARTPADNLQEFVSTLRKQRSEQLEQFDRDIGHIEKQLQAIAGTPEEAQQKEALGKQLTELQTSRSSVVEQYESMITEAERRMAALMAGESPSEYKMN